MSWYGARARKTEGRGVKTAAIDIAQNSTMAKPNDVLRIGYLTSEITFRALLATICVVYENKAPFIRAVYGTDWYNYMFPHQDFEEVPMAFEHRVAHILSVIIPIIILSLGYIVESSSRCNHGDASSQRLRFDSSSPLSLMTPQDSHSNVARDVDNYFPPSNDQQCCGLRKNWQKFAREVVSYLLGLSLAFLLQQCIVTIVKNQYGRPRPDFLARCFASNDPKQWPVSDPMLLPPIPKCTGDDALALEGRRSFPSGHAAYASAMASFVGLWALERLKDIPYTGAWALGPLLACWALALEAALSRTVDYYHNAGDILGGLIVGLVSGAAAWSFYRKREAQEARLQI